MQRTVSENFINNLLDTLNVSCIIFYTFKVKILLNIKNLQVTKTFNSWVGTSEAIRLLYINKNFNFCLRGINIINKYIHSNSNKSKLWKEWLAGLIDGDGSFLLSKKGYASLEITMDIRDEHALQIIKNVYGGSIKLRSGCKAIRYRLHHKAGLLELIHDINGFIRHSNRLIQLNKLCEKYDIHLIYPDKLNYDSGWLAGFFDAAGTITINRNTKQLSISISQKTQELLQPIAELYGGNVYIDRGKYQSFKWYITKREEILKFLKYIKKHPSRSGKKMRLHLITEYYKLKDLREDNNFSDINSNVTEIFVKTNIEKSWEYFWDKWGNYKD